MNTIELVDLTYVYLCKVYGITRSDFVKAKEIPSENHKGHNIKSLLKQNLLLEFVETAKHLGVVDNKSYKWNIGAPQFSLAYNYYNAVRGKNKTYEDLLSILKDPENHKADEILEAISIKGAQEQDMGIELTNDPLLAKTLNKTYVEANHPTLSPSTLIPERKFERNAEFDFLMLETIETLIGKIIDKKFEGFFSDYVIIKELMKEIVDVTIEGGERTKSSQNSISTAIAILKTAQENVFDISATNHFILKELYLQISEKLKNYPDNEEYVKRKENIKLALEHMKSRIDSNNAIINRYGNGKK